MQTKCAAFEFTVSYSTIKSQKESLLDLMTPLL